MTHEEKSERAYLSNLLDKINLAIAAIDAAIRRRKREIDEMHRHMQEHKRDMDHLDKNALRESISNYGLLGDHAVGQRSRLHRLQEVPYFGRIDFRKSEEKQSQAIYVGVQNFRDESENCNLIFDWRAPISAMFYDFEPGPCHYQSKDRIVEGEMTLKRQFRIRNGEMEYMLNSDLTIYDEVLQKELGQTSSGKMKNIVATIQREQNSIIRNEDARHLLIQGVAGSGKTSIALHRIAFLLYKFKDTISSEDILIISPNKVFANYISNVLPELGEETVMETSLEDLAAELFDYQIKFQSFFDQVAELLQKSDTELIDRIHFKSSLNFLKKIDEYLLHLENTGFTPQDIFINKKPVPAWFIEESFQKYHRLPLLKRFNEVVSDIVGNVQLYYKYTIQGKERTELHQTIRKMFPSTTLRKLYKEFYEWLERPELLKMRKGSTYEYSDVFPLLYLKMKLEGLPVFHRVKHLVVDEMQDYSPVQYKILSILYPCKKTILGDINQSVNPFSSSGMEEIKAIFPDAIGMTMLKSYRSTYEIVEFTKKIKGNNEIEAVERYGEQPEVRKLKNYEEELNCIKSWISNFEDSQYLSLGIICKTQKQADELFHQLQELFEVNLLNAVSVAFGSGIVVTTAHLAKGLEFDEVIAPFCSNKNYQTEPDRQMLYVACTRAMHRLRVSYFGVGSSFISK